MHRRKREPVGGGHSDRGRAADREGANRGRNLRGRLASQLDLLVRQAALIEHDHRVELQANDALRLQVVCLAGGLDVSHDEAKGTSYGASFDESEDAPCDARPAPALDRRCPAPRHVAPRARRLAGRAPLRAATGAQQRRPRESSRARCVLPDSPPRDPVRPRPVRSGSRRSADTPPQPPRPPPCRTPRERSTGRPRRRRARGDGRGAGARAGP